MLELRPEYKQERKEGIHDAENSLFVVTVYHENHWSTKTGPNNRTIHYMKYMNETMGYTPENAYETEFFRIARIVDAKVNGGFAQNPIKTIMCFQNLNRGRTKKDVQNQLCYKVVLDKGRILKSENFFVNEDWQGFAEQLTNTIEETYLRTAKNR